MNQADIHRTTGMPQRTITNWVKSPEDDYKNILINFLLSLDKRELEEFVKSRGIEVQEFKDGRVKND